MQSTLVLLTLIGGVASQFSSTGQTNIVVAHNKLRSAIAKGTYVAEGTKKPSATDMLKMKWDSSIAKSAQNYANTCPTGHSHAEGLGENLYWYWTSATLGDLNPYGVNASNSWEKEFQDYGWTSNTMNEATFNSGIGHATQMAWAETNLIGCGVKNCGNDASMSNMNKVAVVCQYKKQGNMMGSPIYTEGATCSKCPSTSSCETSSGLCA